MVRESPLFSFAIVLVTATLVTTVIAESNTNRSEFSDFQLYKNSGFRSCNDTVPQGLTLHTTGSLLKSIFLPRGVENYCAYLAQPVVLLPTEVYEDGFFPWWPTFLVQTVSLPLSYVGLVFTYNSLKKIPSITTRKENNVPVVFWILLGVDLVRVGVWFFKQIQGFVVAKRFYWSSSVLWLLPFAYAFVVSAIKAHRGSLPQSDSSLNKPLPPDLAERRLIPDSKHKSLELIRKALLSLSFIMFLFTVTSAILHFIPATIIFRSIPYGISSSTIQTLSSNSEIPDKCVNWLKSTDLRSLGLFNQTVDQRLSAGLHIFGLFTAFVTVFTHFLRKRRKNYRKDASYETLRDCAFVTIVVLAGCALATTMYVAISIGKKRRAVELRFTNDMETTDGCTFAWISMDKAWGYWDVKEGLWWRILLAALGV